MTGVRMEGLVKRFAGKPPTTAMDGLSLDIDEGEFLVLLGPSGCGKTTTLRCLAGLETPDAGQIAFGSRTVFDSRKRLNLTPDRRNIGMVFQSYALWPHMTVRRNIAYPLRARKLNKAETASWVVDTAAIVDCEGLLDRYPAQLSGGQQQRVALARGLVARPDVVLFDEPLSNLDARLRDSVRAQLHELHGQLNFTAVFVTHDQSEALALADRLAIMRDGRFEQVDVPERVFEQPHTEYVAGFIGMSNRLPIERSATGLAFSGAEVSNLRGVAGVAEGATIRLRPEDLRLASSAEQLPVDECHFTAKVVDSQFGGRHIDVTIAVNGSRLHARIASGELGGWARRLAPHEDVVVGFDRHCAVVYGPDEVRVAGHASLLATAPGTVG